MPARLGTVASMSATALPHRVDPLLVELVDRLETNLTAAAAVVADPFICPESAASASDLELLADAVAAAGSSAAVDLETRCSVLRPTFELSRKLIQAPSPGCFSLGADQLQVDVSTLASRRWVPARVNESRRARAEVASQQRLSTLVWATNQVAALPPRWL